MKFINSSLGRSHYTVHIHSVILVTSLGTVTFKQLCSAEVNKGETAQT